MMTKIEGRTLLYAGSRAIAGPLRKGDSVEYVDIMGRKDKKNFVFLVMLNIVTGTGFLTFLLWPTNLPRLSWGPWVFTASVVAISLMVLIEVIRLLQASALLTFAARTRDPVPLAAPPGLRAAILTTIVPGKEPLDLVVRTLEAMKAVRHNGPVDVWLLDEGNDPEVRAACERIGVRHFSRHRVEKWNQPAGAFKARTKAGNHNAWRDAHEQAYDVVAQMDPDHVPSPDFLERSVGYFVDPDVGFVVAPQVYGNLRESWIAHGAAIQAYVFHGIIQRGGNGLRAPLLIGTNHLYRPAAFRHIGGYQDSIIEDHLTSMAMFGAINPATGQRWKGVYTPDILAVGEGPTSFTDYFNQQKRWAYGIWEIMRQHSPKMFGDMHRGQRISFALLQMFYPSVAVAFVMSNLLTFLYMMGGARTQIPLGWWAFWWTASVTASLATFFWLRRFNLVTHERREYGLVGMGLLLLCAPVYVMAMVEQLARRPLTYAVTAKGSLTSPDTLATFRPHLFWLALGVPVLVANVVFGIGQVFVVVQFWLLVTIAIAATPILVHVRTKMGESQHADLAWEQGRQREEPMDQLA